MKNQKAPVTHYLMVVATNTAWQQTEFYTACSLDRTRERDRVFYICSGNVTWEPWDISTNPNDTTCPRCKKSSHYKKAVDSDD